MDQIRPLKFIQGNLNHCCAAQNILCQSLLQWTIVDVAVMAEPYFIPPAPSNPYWVADSLESVVVVGSSEGNSAPPKALAKGRGYVAVLWEGFVVIGVYFSPNKTLAEFETYMDELTEVVRRMAQRQVLVMGDLNAKATDWGSPRTDARGRVVCEWAAATGLVLLNRGTELTCVRQRGGSIVDVTFASPSVADRVRDWRVMVDEETLSDHRYIRFDIFSSSSLF
jgi:hypothetical protein